MVEVIMDVTATTTNFRAYHFENDGWSPGLGYETVGMIWHNQLLNI
jgi:hypothetical protein